MAFLGSKPRVYLCFFPSQTLQLARSRFWAVAALKHSAGHERWLSRTVWKLVLTLPSGVSYCRETTTGREYRDHWKPEKVNYMGIDIHVLSVGGWGSC